MRILFVCSGNTCRSPLATFLARKIVQGYGDEIASQFSFTSAGTGAADGQPASEHARTLATQMAGRPGRGLEGHRSAALTAANVEEADLILTMTSAHRRAVERLAPMATERTFTLKEYAAHARQAMKDHHHFKGEAKAAAGAPGPAPGPASGPATAGFAPASDFDSHFDSQDITDPFGGDLATYHRAAAEIEAELRDILAWLVTQRHGQGRRGSKAK